MDESDDEKRYFRVTLACPTCGNPIETSIEAELDYPDDDIKDSLPDYDFDLRCKVCDKEVRVRQVLKVIEIPKAAHENWPRQPSRT